MQLLNIDFSSYWKKASIQGIANVIYGKWKHLELERALKYMNWS